MAARGATDRWPAWRVERLRALWRIRALSGKAIAERLGMSPSAVFAKAADLNLPPRYPDRATRGGKA